MNEFLYPEQNRSSVKEPMAPMNFTIFTTNPESSTMPTLFARKLKELRQLHKLTQDQMAARLGIDPSRISRVEHDVHPSSLLIERLYKVFGVHAHEWLSEEEITDEPLPEILPRVVHLRSASAQEQNDDVGLRAKTVALLERMMDMLETITRNSRGGGG